MGMQHVVYLGLGTNLGNKKANIRRAVRKIEELIGTVERQSALYETEPWGFSSENMFVNAVVRVRTELSPMQLLRVTQQIERDMGRTRKSVRRSGSENSISGDSQLHSGEQLPVYHDRPIDIDILLYDDLTVDEPELKIPHPLMQERDFVMIPLREIIDEDQVP
jgi:2-amino-4-hydroxy-6-hydroxymethyldihydropteridine diphosphokinase